MVGTSGSAAERLAAVIASPRKFPARTCVEVGGRVLNAIGVCAASADWISGGHHDRYSVGGLVRGQAGRGTPGHDHVDREIHQLGRERRKSLGLPLRKTIHEEMSLSFDIAEVAQPVPQSL